MKKMMMLIAAVLVGAPVASNAADSLDTQIDKLADQVQPHVITYRRYLHQHPELSNREVETAKYVAEHLKQLGIDVQTGVATTGVVGVLKGGKPGPVVALRADMDALPVTEEVDLPFKSTVKSMFDGKEVGVMHACGHDAHTSMLLGVAEVIAQLKDQWPGTVKFIFQPAEESAPYGEKGGAEEMVKQGVLANPKPDVIFGQHVFSEWEAGQVAYHPGAAMASADDMVITVTGKGTHGAAPWRGIDPIVVSAQIVLALQTIASRQMEVTKAPVIVSVGKIEGGTRDNIIPDAVEMKGTLRALDADMRKDLQVRVKRTVENIAESAGAKATVVFGSHNHYPVTVNDPKLAARMLPTLERVAGEKNVHEVPALLGAEDFSYFAEKVPGFYVFLGSRPPKEPKEGFPTNHSPRFRIDEAVLPLGVKTLAHLAADYAGTH
jgi:amidohydrolase